jgi:hypothetical protein
MENSNLTRDEMNEYYQNTYGVELYLQEKPEIETDLLIEQLTKRCGKVKIVEQKENLLLIMFNEYMIEYEDTEVPAQLAIMITDKKPELENLKLTIAQSWAFSNAEDTVKKAKYSVLVTDIMAAGLEYYSRIDLFQKSLYSLVEQLPCIGINWLASQQIVSPKLYLENRPWEDKYNVLFGALNVRLFKVAEDGNKYIMDTLGLSALGLHDLECTFENIDTNEMANYLYENAEFIFQEGNLLNPNGNILAIDKKTNWGFEEEMSLVEPKRYVFKITPTKV